MKIKILIGIFSLVVAVSSGYMFFSVTPPEISTDLHFSRLLVGIFSLVIAVHILNEAIESNKNKPNPNVQSEQSK